MCVWHIWNGEFLKIRCEQYPTKSPKSCPAYQNCFFNLMHFFPPHLFDSQEFCLDELSFACISYGAFQNAQCGLMAIILYSFFYESRMLSYSQMLLQIARDPLFI